MKFLSLLLIALTAVSLNAHKGCPAEDNAACATSTSKKIKNAITAGQEAVAEESSEAAVEATEVVSEATVVVEETDVK